MDELNNWHNTLSVVLAIGNPIVLKNLTGRISNPNINFPNLIAPDVTFYDKRMIEFGKGNVIFFHSIISYDVKLDDFNLLNTGVFVGHNTKIGSCNVLNSSVRISGSVCIGNYNFFGVCAVVLQKLIIGQNTKISAGSCIYRNTKDNNLYIGNPAVIKPTPN
jgi:acetyltransferase-like isoleucine patch superfamily enzyme